MTRETGATSATAPSPNGAAPAQARVQAAGPLYFSADDVAAMLQVSRSTVFRWAKQDPTMPVLAIGGVVRFPRERLLVWLRTRERGSVARPRAGHPGGHTGDAGGPAATGGA